MGYSPEYAALEGDPTYLAGLAEAGGGAVLEEPTEAVAHNIKGFGVRQDLWPYLLALAALLLPFDVGVRRLALGRRDFARMWEWVLARLWSRRRPVAEAPSPVGRLFQAKARTETQRPRVTPLEVPPPAPAERPREAPSPALPRSTGEGAPASPGRVGAEGETLAGRLLKKKQRRGE
jgi:hypothetical protein